MNKLFLVIIVLLLMCGVCRAEEENPFVVAQAIAFEMGYIQGINNEDFIKSYDQFEGLTHSILDDQLIIDCNLSAYLLGYQHGITGSDESCIDIYKKIFTNTATTAEIFKFTEQSTKLSNPKIDKLILEKLDEITERTNKAKED